MKSRSDGENHVPISIGSCLSILVIALFIFVVLGLCILIIYAWLDWIFFGQTLGDEEKDIQSGFDGNITSNNAR